MRLPSDEFWTIHHADGKTRQVIFVRFIHSRHFGRFTTDQRTAGLPAALRDAFNHRLGIVDFQFSGGVVIEKKQRFSTTGQDVIDTHGNQVDSDGVMAVELPRQQQLGAHAIGAGYQ